jgi:hypothetical protein
VQSELDARRADLDFATGSVYHLHIQGQPGVGKTRFALELCRDAAWRGAVIYIRQAADLRLAELIDGAVADAGVLLTVVADEVQAEQLRPLRDSVGRGRGRVRLITVGNSQTPDPTRIPALLVKPLDPQVMAKVVNGWHTAMPPEHVNFVVRFADGYVRLARLAADAVAHNATMDVRGLLSRDEIRGFLDGMLGAGDRRALHVVAVLASVGWTGDEQDEGKAVARHLGLDWNSVRATVENFQNRLGIAPRGGRYRYISPTHRSGLRTDAGSFLVSTDRRSSACTGKTPAERAMRSCCSKPPSSRIGDRKPVPVLQTEFAEGLGTFSPDGHWIAYFSDESGQIEVYVRSFTEGGARVTSGKWRVSTRWPAFCLDGGATARSCFSLRSWTAS